jgi:hypothetical protein
VVGISQSTERNPVNSVSANRIGGNTVALFR